MRILFRVDAGIQMGSGHVARCLTLADALVQTGGTAEFICRDHDGDLTPWISQRGHRVQRLKTTQENRQAFQGDLAHSAWLGISQSEDAQQTLNAVSDDFFDWIVVDHYALDHRWHTRLREKSDHILAIDDLADRVHDADVLIDQNDRYVESNRYQDLVP